MPLAWVEPDVFLRHGGFTVYHKYKRDDYANGRMNYKFTLDMLDMLDDDGGTQNHGTFDVRELPPIAGADLKTDDGRKATIIDAIDASYFDDWENEDGERYKQFVESPKPVTPYTWDDLVKDILAMTPAQRKLRVRCMEPYQDEAEMLAPDTFNPGDPEDLENDPPHLA
jgi:hypothetical protein